MADLPSTADISGRRLARVLAGLSQLGGGSESEPMAPFAPLTDPFFNGTVVIYDKVEIGSPVFPSPNFTCAMGGRAYFEGATTVIGFTFFNTSTSAQATLTGVASDFYEFNAVGGWLFRVNSAAPALAVDVNGVTTTKFAANGATPQAAYTLPANATDLPTAIALVNAIKAALIANGICA